METAEPASASTGPRYAPDDPTLPKPWKGLIDGSTSLMYYWNPETNVTQYEKPASLTPPLPLGPPPAASTPKLAPIPVAHSVPQNSVLAHQHGQQMMQVPQQQGQQGNQHGHLMSQQQNSQLGSEQSQSHPTPLHQSDADDDDDNVKQLKECSSLYLALQDCLVNTNRNWKSCQIEVQALKSCNERKKSDKGK